MAASVHCMRKVTVTRYTNVFGETGTEKSVWEKAREDVDTKRSV